MTTHGRRFVIPSQPVARTLGASRTVTAAPPWRRLVLLCVRSVAGWLMATASVFAGVGLAYLLRGAGGLALGPRVAGALPLQQLAGGESQPLLRLAVAWLCAGAVAGLALASLTRSRLATRTTGAAVLAWVLLLAAGAVADAVAISDPIGPHIAPQLSRAGTWIATGLFCAAVLAVGIATRRREPRPGQEPYR